MTTQTPTQTDWLKFRQGMPEFGKVVECLGSKWDGDYIVRLKYVPAKKPSKMRPGRWVSQGGTPYSDWRDLSAWRDIPQPVATPELKLQEWFFESDIKGFQTAPTLKVLYFGRPSKAITREQYEYGATKLGFIVRN